MSVLSVWYVSVPPEGAPLRGFNVRFPADTGAGPSNSDMEERLGVTAYVETDTGQVISGRRLLQYDVILDPPIYVGGGTNWVSVQAIRDDDRWYWMAAEVLPPLHGSNIYVRDPRGTTPGWGTTWNGNVLQWDVSFTLWGSVVPEPATPTLLAAASAALAARRRAARHSRTSRPPRGGGVGAPARLHGLAR